MRILPCTPPWLGLALSIALSLATRSGLADELNERILSLRERAEITDQILEDRLDTVVPQVMRAAGIDAWVLIAREYNEDPIVKTMLPATWLNARRRTVLMFIDQGPELGVARMAVARYPVGTLPVIDPATGETLVDALGRRSYTTSIAYGPTVGKNIALAYLPADFAQVGRELAVEYFAQSFPVEVAGVGYAPLYDPQNLKPRS